MYCSHKTQFNNGNFDEKPIVTMAVTINRSKALNSLDIEGLLSLKAELARFSKTILASAEEVENRINELQNKTSVNL